MCISWILIKESYTTYFCMPKCWIKVQLIPHIFGLLRYHQEKNCNWKPATYGSVAVETTNTVQYICIDMHLTVSLCMCSVTLFLIVCGYTKGRPHSSVQGPLFLYMDAGSQCWYTVDLVFTEATAYWYTVASYYMKWAALYLSC